MKPIARNKLVFFFLSLLFIAPGLSAYLFYMHPEWLSHSTTNKGRFLNPPHTLLALDDKHAWRIILWSPEGCDAVCIQSLDQLARVRLALGRRFYDVQFWLAQRADAPLATPQIRRALKENAIQELTLSEHDIKHAALPASPAIFLANPTRYLVLEYAMALDPNDIFHDLKLLLTADKASN